MTRTFSLAATFALLTILLIGLGHAVALPATAAPSPGVHVQSSGAGGLILDVVAPEPRREALGAGSNGTEQLVLDGYTPGPEGLPLREVLIGLPPTGGVSLRIEAVTPPRMLQGPLPGVFVPRVAREEAGLVLEAGQEWQPLPDAPRALPLAAIVDEGWSRDSRLARLRLAPLAYLGDGRWQMTAHFRVHVTFEMPVSASSSTSDPAPLSSALQTVVVNAEQAAKWRTSTPPIRSSTVYNLPATTWRIGVTADGLYRLTYEALAGAGVPVATADPADVHLWWRNQEVALQEIGMADGSLDPGDAFLFYAQKFHGSVQDEKYTDENVYWLAIDAGQPGLRLAARSVAPGTAPAATWYTHTIRSEENNVYWGRWSDDPGTDATWFWERILAVSPVTHTYPVTLTDLSPDTYTAILRVEVAARNEHFLAPDHHLRLSINGTAVGEDTWDGKVGRVITLPLASGLLVEGVNQVGVTPLTDVTTQDIYVNWVELTVRRQMVAEDDQLAFLAPFGGEADYTLTGFSANILHLYDLSDPLAPIALTGAAVVAAGPTWNLDFTDAGAAGQPYLALADAAIADAPAPAFYQPPLDLLSAAKGADEIIVAPDAFYAAIQPLAAHRRAEGLRVEVVRAEDVYALFNGGVFHPQAIRDFVAYAYENWQPPAPAYVLLVGDGHFNFKGYNPGQYGAMTPVYVPPYLDFIDPWQGEVPVDTRFGQIVGDDVFPDVAVGRLAANSAQEVADVVAKIITYETAAPDAQETLMFVADNVPDAGGDFETVLNELASDYVPAWMQLEKVYLTDFCGPPTSPPTECPSATLALTSTWSQGAAMLNFLGHGSVHRWTHEPLLLNTQIDSLQPGHQLPFVVTLNCLDGYWMMPPDYPGLNNTRSMAEWMTIRPTIGSIANFSPSGLGTTSAEDVIARNMYDALFNDGERRLGEIALVGQLTTVGYPAHLPQVSTLFGDPAGWLRMAAGLSLAPESQARSGVLGSQVTYNLTLVNESGHTETAALAADGNWPMTLSTGLVQDLAPGASVPISVTVSVPATATVGSVDAVTLTVTSTLYSEIRDTATLTTTAVEALHYVYLPLVRRE